MRQCDRLGVSPRAVHPAWSLQRPCPKIPPAMSDSDIKKSNILVVDDEREHAQVMCEALTRLGHKCDVTYNLAEAAGKLAKKQYDVVVTDLVMEGRREGLDVMREALKKQPPPPVVLVTAHGDVPT